MKQFLICSRIKCKSCKTIIHSKTIHDFVTCECGKVSLDGGTAYKKITGSISGYKDKSIFNNDKFKKIRKYFCRFNRKTGEFVPLCLIDSDWLDNIITYYLPGGEDTMNDNFLLLYIKEKQFRNIKEKQ